jgi:AcrR family transcriptional regulator
LTNSSREVDLTTDQYKKEDAVVNKKILANTKIESQTDSVGVNQRRSRGRPRIFDSESAVKLALERFRRDGYSATSTGAIAADCGASPTSLFAVFPTKLSLFAATLARYEAEMANSFADIDSSPAANLPRAILLWAAGSYADSGPQGCLALQHLGESNDPGVRACAIASHDRFKAHIARTLADAGCADAERRAQTLVVAMMGLSTAARMGFSAETLKQCAADLALSAT